MCKEFCTNWIINREKGAFIFFGNNRFLKTSICLAFLTSGLRLFYSFIQSLGDAIQENVFRIVFDLEGMGFILVVDDGLKEQFSCEGNFRYE